MALNDVNEELLPSELAVLAEDSARWQRMGAGAHLDDWLAYGPGLIIRRRLAMRLTHVNKPEGRGYAEAMAALMKRDGLDTMDKTGITSVLWLNGDPERLSILREIRDAMSVGERARLNSPISARQRVQRVLKARDNGAEASQRTSPVTVLRQQIAEKDREIAQLKAKLAATDGGSLFDLHRETPENIGKAVVWNVVESRALKIAAAIKNQVAEKKRKIQKPAG